MKIPKQVTEVLAGAGLAYVGTRDAENIPHVGRVHGWRLDGDQESLHLLLPAYCAETAARDVADNGQVAFTVGSSDDQLVTFQLKGDGGVVGPVDDQDLEVHAHYLDRLAASLAQRGYPEPLVRTAYSAPSSSLRFRVRDIFVQTPGPGAGARLEADE
jgi:hypothetical protein